MRAARVPEWTGEPTREKVEEPEVRQGVQLVAVVEVPDSKDGLSARFWAKAPGDCEAINPASASVIQDAGILTMPLLFEGSYSVEVADGD